VPSSRPIDYNKIFEPITAATKAWRNAEDGSYATDQSEEIFKNVLPAVLERFVRKNADYGGTAHFLGAKGQFADINPKFWKLKRALWDGEKLVGESVEEILDDLIGHCLLALYFIGNERPIFKDFEDLRNRDGAKEWDTTEDGEPGK
jgi:hypothetical protein